MTYLQDKKKKRDVYIKVLLALSALVCFLLGATTIKDTLLPVANGIFGTGGQAFNKVGVGVSNSFTTKSALQGRVRELEAENLTLKTKEENYLIQENELQGLRQALDLSEQVGNTVFGKITSARSVYGSFLVRTGSTGTQQGDIVLDSLGSLLGFVSTVDGVTVTAIGLDSLKDPVELYLLDSDTTLEAGRQSRGVLMAKVPRETIIEVGEVAVFSGTQIKVGTVVDFSKDEKDPFKEVYIRMSAKVKNGSIVSVVSKN
jgi:cell shape-determining protein MreC